MSSNPRLYLIDGSGYIFRAYYAIRPLSTRTGMPTNAVVGFARMLAKLLREEKPQLLGIAFDSRAKTFRHGIYAEYKANRDAPPEDLAPQFALIHELVEAMDIPLLKQDGFEADDLIATLAHRASDTFNVVVVSGDKDLMQVVRRGVQMYDPMKDKRYDDDAVRERFGVPPDRVADVQALAGDSSDNIPGVPKVGPKSAAKLVSQYGDVEAVIQGLKTKPHTALKAFERSVLENSEAARISKKLTVLATDAPVPLDPERLTYTRPQGAKLGPFLRKIEAYTLLRDFGVQEAPSEGSQPSTGSERGSEASGRGESAGSSAAAAHAAGGSDTASAAPPSAVPSASSAAAGGGAGAAVGAAGSALPVVHIDRSVYGTLLTLGEVEALATRARAAGRVSVDLETTSLDPNRADIVGLSLCVPDSPAAYIPVAHRYPGAPPQLCEDDVLKALRPVLEDASICKVGQNLKYDWVVLARHGVEMQGIGDDSMLASYVLDPSRPSFGLDALSRDALGHQTITFAEVAGRGKAQIPFDQVPLDAATAYAAEDADVALRLCDHYGAAIEREGLQKVYRNLELPLLPVLARMEQTGVRIDVGALDELALELTARLADVEATAHGLIGSPINLASPKQLSHLFFEKLGYPVVKKTKTGYSTDQEVLEVLARDHELPGVILQHRLLSKLKSTYVDALPRMVNPHTGRVHTSFNQTGAATGRLSSSDPNLQNIPIRTDDGRRIREAFVAEPGWVLISADYSQIELRVLAHLCADPSFVEAFANNEDIHSRTAREILTGGAEPTAEQRRAAKAINFGIIYGLSEFGLAKQLDIPRGEARAYISSYFARYPKIRTFFDSTFERARASGYVTTLSGRRRYLPELSSRNQAARRAAERVAMNTPIQGSAADLIKEAMINVDAALHKSRSRARLLLQVHDELVLEAPEEERESVAQLVREHMEGVMRLSVPLVVEVGVGPNWGVAH